MIMRRCHVNSAVTGGHVDRLHDFALRQLQAPSVSACDHRACGVGILSLPAEPSPCRGDAARARHCRLLRDGAAVGDEVPARLCPPPQAQESEPPRYLAHLGEVVIIIGVKQHWLWRAVDQNGYIIDEIVQTRRDTKAAKRLLTRLLKKQGCPPRRMITDKLGSYAAARRQIMPAIEHRSHKGLNNRAENSHLPLRRRERAMQGFRSPGGLQRFIAVFSAVRNLFVPPRSRRSALATHLHRLNAVAQWKAVAGIAA